jgi:hypothetical protein
MEDDTATHAILYLKRRRGIPRAPFHADRSPPGANGTFDIETLHSGLRMGKLIFTRLGGLLVVRGGTRLRIEDKVGPVGNGFVRGPGL